MLNRQSTTFIRGCYLIKNELEINLNLEGAWRKRGLLNRLYYWSIFSFARCKSGFPNNNSEARILDLGCGDGFISNRLYQTGIRNIVAFDYNPLAGRINYPFKCITGRIPDDINLIPEHELFDYVLILGVLHHLDFDKVGEVFLRIGRLLKPGGCVILWEPCDTLTLKLMYFLVKFELLRSFGWFKRTYDCLNSESEIIRGFIDFFYEIKNGAYMVRSDRIMPFKVKAIATCWHGKIMLLESPTISGRRQS